MNFKYKYLKYKQKYLLSRNQKGGECKKKILKPDYFLEAHRSDGLFYGRSIKSLVIHPLNDKLMATCNDDTTVKIWYNTSLVKIPIWNHVATLEGVLAGHKKPVMSIAFHPIASPNFILATGSEDNTVKLWELKIVPNKKKIDWSAKCITTLEGHSHWVTAVAFHPTQPIIISGSFDNTVKVWLLCANNQTATCVATLNNKTQVRCINFHPTAHPPIIAVGCARKNQKDKNTNINLWSLSPYYSSGTLVTTLSEHIEQVNSVVFNPTNSNIMASCSDDNTAILWELDFSNWKHSKKIATFGKQNDYTPNKVGEIYKEHKYGSIKTVTFCPNKYLLAYSSEFDRVGHINWWSFKKEDSNYVTICEASTEIININFNSIVYNKSEELIAGCSDGVIRGYFP